MKKNIAIVCISLAVISFIYSVIVIAFVNEWGNEWSILAAIITFVVSLSVLKMSEQPSTEK